MRVCNAQLWLDDGMQLRISPTLMCALKLEQNNMQETLPNDLFAGVIFSEDRIVTGWMAPQCKIFPISTTSRPTLGPNHPPIQLVSVAFPRESRRAIRLTTGLHLVPMSEIVELYLHSCVSLKKSQQSKKKFVYSAHATSPDSARIPTY
jgi:hypothetical protein